MSGLKHGEHLRAFSFISISSAVLCIGFAMLGFVSWTTPDLALLPFRAIPASAFLLVGIAIATATRSASWLVVLSKLTAGSVLTASLANLLFQPAGSASSGIFCDNAFLALNSALFGMMSTFDNTGFALISASILLRGVKLGRHIFPSEWLALSCVLLSVMATLGSLFQQARFCLFVSCQQLSLTAVFVYGLASLGALLLNSDRGFIGILSSPYAGGQSARRMLPAALLIPILLGSLHFFGLKLNIYNAEAGLTLAVFLMIAAFIALVWFNSHTLDKKDRSLKETLATLSESEKRVKTIINESVDAFVAIDQTGVVREWNSRAEALFGWTRAEMVGKSDCNSFCPEVHKHLLKLLQEKGDAVHGELLETAAHYRDGGTINIEVMPFLVWIGAEPVSCAFIRDVTERKQLQQRFNDFYHALSHELRAPLTSIKMSLGLVEKLSESLTPNAVEHLNAATTSSDRLLNLVNELLDLRRIELGKFVMQVQTADPITLAQISMDTLKSLAGSRRVELVVVAETTCQIKCDPDRMVQVLVNLLTNAIKFSPANSQVIVQISELDDGMVRFAVSDRGPGINVEMKGQLFEAFAPDVSGSQANALPRSGLGLALARQMLHEMGGAIDHENNAHGGSTFWLVIPKAEQAAEPVGV